ncbi:hypothetical protein Mhar_1640 [Methanothrix harundinacea 6Ac]|uniref:AAA domain-containing protein n=2 Tax=Methanothrix harundinacea TaxID=301375 RepID=G7WPW9_METH6|nr:hypothetical protein Mhar_1640 [Methanothrix harundinacea 6Ac]
MDEARQSTINYLRSLIDEVKPIERVVLIDDIFGLLRVVLWLKTDDKDELRKRINEELKEKASPYWSEEIYFAPSEDEVEELFYERAWNEGLNDDSSESLRIVDRYRSHGSWLQSTVKSPWKVTGKRGGPPIIVFYSFKGGVGRSTALSSFAIQRTRMGEKVTVIDFDLDAPGIGVLLAADSKGTTAPWGVLDYMLERPYGKVVLGDYVHACRREEVTGSGEIKVIPAGQMDERYPSKLSRIDFEIPQNGQKLHPFILLLNQIRDELKPDWLLIDARAGLSEAAGLLLGGLAHMYVVFGTSSEQSWQGIRLILRRLGYQRVLEGESQLECLLVQAMITDVSEVAKSAIESFKDRARDEFAQYYYSADPENEEDEEDKDFWYVRDSDDEYAPHVPVAIRYQQFLAHFDVIDDVADRLTESPGYPDLAERITSRFGK